MSDLSLQLLLDRAEISEVVARFATALDLQDWALFRSCFTDEIEADYSDLRGEPPAVIGADAFVAQRCDALKGLKTQHLSTNHIINIEGDAATCTSCAVIHRLRPLAVGHNTFARTGTTCTRSRERQEGGKYVRCGRRSYGTQGTRRYTGFTGIKIAPPRQRQSTFWKANRRSKTEKGY